METVADVEQNVEDPVPLFYGPQVEDLEFIAYQETAKEMLVDTSAGAPHSLVGHWSGSVVYDRPDGHPGDPAVFSFTISAVAEDSGISGSGIDLYGLFTLMGALEGDDLTLVKEYTAQHSADQSVYQYRGTVDEEQDAISGTWGLPDQFPQSVVPEPAEMSYSLNTGVNGDCGCDGERYAFIKV